MRYLAAYLLATLSGKTDPSAGDIEKILSSVGIDSDKKKLQLVMDKLKGKNIEASIAEGSKKLSSLPAAGPAAAAAPAAAATKDAGKPAAKEEPKKAEKEKEPEEEDDMGFGLFD